MDEIRVKFMKKKKKRKKRKENALKTIVPRVSRNAIFRQ